MTTATARQRDGRSVVITNSPKRGMSVFTIFGYVEGDLRQPCHWLADGRYRMDGQPDPRDLVHHGDLTAKITDHERAEMIYEQPSLLYRHLLAS